MCVPMLNDQANTMSCICDVAPEICTWHVLVLFAYIHTLEKLLFFFFWLFEWMPTRCIHSSTSTCIHARRDTYIQIKNTMHAYLLFEFSCRYTFTLTTTHTHTHTYTRYTHQYVCTHACITYIHTNIHTNTKICI